MFFNRLGTGFQKIFTTFLISFSQFFISCRLYEHKFIFLNDPSVCPGTGYRSLGCEQYCVHGSSLFLGRTG